jgi:hypothetical protein
MRPMRPKPLIPTCGERSADADDCCIILFPFSYLDDHVCCLLECVWVRFGVGWMDVVVVRVRDSEGCGRC